MALYESTLHGLTSSTPVCTKSSTLRVAQIAPRAKKTAAICARSVPLLGSSTWLDQLEPR